jgi:hypothetical protein
MSVRVAYILVRQKVFELCECLSREASSVHLTFPQGAALHFDHKCGTEPGRGKKKERGNSQVHVRSVSAASTSDLVREKMTFSKGCASSY